MDIAVRPPPTTKPVTWDRRFRDTLPEAALGTQDFGGYKCNCELLTDKISYGKSEFPGIASCRHRSGSAAAARSVTASRERFAVLKCKSRRSAAREAGTTG